MGRALLPEFGLEQEGVGDSDPPSLPKTGKDRHLTSGSCPELHVASLEAGLRPHEDHVASFDHLDSVFRHCDAVAVDFARRPDPCLKEGTRLKPRNAA